MRVVAGNMQSRSSRLEREWPHHSAGSCIGRRRIVRVTEKPSDGVLGPVRGLQKHRVVKNRGLEKHAAPFMAKTRSRIRSEES